MTDPRGLILGDRYIPDFYFNNHAECAGCVDNVSPEEAKCRAIDSDSSEIQSPEYFR
jgi:hypothetical protein